MAEDKTLDQRLMEPIPKAMISHRRGPGHSQVPYIKSLHGIRQANQIFGPLGWSDQTVRGPTPLRVGGEEGYTCTVEVRVGDCVKQGSALVFARRSAEQRNSGQAANAEAHWTAYLGSESKATVRALRKIGEAFGLVIYESDDDDMEFGVDPDGPRGRSNGSQSSANFDDVVSNLDELMELAGQIGWTRDDLDAAIRSKSGGRGLDDHSDNELRPWIAAARKKLEQQNG